MYYNLEAEMARRGVSRTDLARAINKKYQAVSLKLNGKSRFIYEETLAIKAEFFPDCNIEYLFASKQSQPDNITPLESKTGQHGDSQNNQRGQVKG